MTAHGDAEADRGQNTGLQKAECRHCGHPVSARTNAALLAAIRDHEQRPRPPD